MEGGIYCIQNKVNGKRYIGRTINFKRRFGQYAYYFRERRIEHINQYLLASMEKHGFDNFEFSIVESCEPEKQPDREMYWMNYYGTLDRYIGYNLRSDVDGAMLVHESTRRKISDRLKHEWSNGVRVGHSGKMVESWKCRDKSFQADVMSKALTRWVYIVNGESMKYRELK